MVSDIIKNTHSRSGVALAMRHGLCGLYTPPTPLRATAGYIFTLPYLVTVGLAQYDGWAAECSFV